MSDSANWGDDLSGRIPERWRADYVKWRARLGANDENDEIIALCGFLEILTRIGLDTADRVEKAARASLAGQKAMLLFSRYLRIALRNARRGAFLNIWFYAFLFVTVTSTAGLLDVEFQSASQIDQIRKDADEQKQELAQQNAKERLATIGVLGKDAQMLRRIMDAGVQLKYQDYVYQDGTKGFLLGSTAAVNATFSNDPQNRPVGVLYFRYTPPSASAGSAPQ